MNTGYFSWLTDATWPIWGQLWCWVFATGKMAWFAKPCGAVLVRWRAPFGPGWAPFSGNTVDWKLCGVSSVSLFVPTQVYSLLDYIRLNVIKSFLNIADIPGFIRKTLWPVTVCRSKIHHFTAPVAEFTAWTIWIWQFWNMRRQWRCSNKQNGKEVQDGLARSGVEEREVFSAVLAAKESIQKGERHRSGRSWEKAKVLCCTKMVTVDDGWW